jgi:hypothetical protein
MNIEVSVMAWDLLVSAWFISLSNMSSTHKERCYVHDEAVS